MALKGETDTYLINLSYQGLIKYYMQIFCFYYSLTNGAGTEKVIVNLLNYLVKEDTYNKVSFLSVHSYESPFFQIDERVVIEQLNVKEPSNSPSIFQKICYFLNIISKMRRWVKPKMNQKIVLVCGHPFLAICTFIATRIFFSRNINIVACEHFAFSVSSVLSKRIKRFFYRYMTIVTLTDSDRKELESFSKYVVCIPNSIKNIPVKNADINSRILLSIGRLHVQKGYDYLLQSIGTIKEKLNGWKLWIIGEDKGEKLKLEKLMIEYKIEHIVELKPPIKDVENVYQSSSIFLMSSRFEGFPMVLLEACSFGLPVVSFDCPTGPRDIITNDFNGFLIKCYDTEAFAEKLLTLVQNREMRIQMGEGSRNKASKFLENEVMVKWHDLFKKFA